MSKDKKRHYNRPFSGKLTYTGYNSISTAVNCWHFNAHDYHVNQLASTASIPNSQFKNYKLWVQVCGLSSPDMIDNLKQQLDISQGDIQDILTADHVTKTSFTNKSILLIVKDFYYDEMRTLKVEHICFLLYQDYVVSFQESNRPIFENVVKAIKTNTNKVREKSTDYLFGILLDSIVNNYVEVIGNIEQALENMEESLVTANKLNDNIGIKILNSRKSIQQMKRSIIPLKEQFPRLIHPDDSDLIRKENTGYFIDINDHLQLVVQLLEACREEVNALFDLNIANNELRMNEIMKRLTVVATIFIPLTFIVGLWGMNFDFMPEVKWKLGYLFAWIILLIVGLGTWWYLAKRKWF